MQVTDNIFPGGPAREHNLSREFIADCERRLGLRFVPEATGEPDTFAPEDVFHYIYAIFHAPAYRERYAEFLRIDFPRVPLTTDVALFRMLTGLGKELCAWHLLRHPALDALAGLDTAFPVAGGNRVERGHPRYDAARKRVYINREQYFAGIPPELWEFPVGGYQPLRKWLADRRGRALAVDDTRHYQQIARALAETRQLMAAIDARIAAAGGFPLA